MFWSELDMFHFGEALKKIISQNLVAAIVTKVDTKVDIN